MNGIILVNKPKNITSHDLVQMCRRKLHTTKIGHTGTLDPLADGLMLITIGNATKVLPFMSHYFKEYVATMQFGYRTDTLDCEGKTLESGAVNPVGQNQAETVLKSFLGKSRQMPPMYSAKKVKGQHLYDLARKNIQVEREPIDIEITEIELLQLTQDSLTYRVKCSTGCYVRVLCQDIAEKLNNLATMTSLKRTKIDRYDIKDSYQIDELDENVRVIDIYDALDSYRYVEYQPIKDVYNGKRITLDADLPDTVMITNNHTIVAAYSRDDDGMFYCKRGLW